ncbi:MAG: PA2169 family four-helix-bundle protein [Brumimicrobium sp.]
MKNENTVETLNKLITINNDRVEGYQTASENSEEVDLKTMFSQFISTSQKCKRELEEEVNAIGGNTSDDTKTSGKFFRAWMDVKAALTGKDRKAILDSCEFGEDKALETYDDVIKDEFQYLGANQKNMIVDQKSLIKKDHDHVKSLRDALAAS